MRQAAILDRSEADGAFCTRQAVETNKQKEADASLSLAIVICCSLKVIPT